jgi:hypothetical protein
MGGSITQWDCINQPNVQWKLKPVVMIGAAKPKEVATQKSPYQAIKAAIVGAPGPYYAIPSWDQTIPCTAITNCPRFLVLSNMESAAVLDKETGLVWESTPSLNSFLNWYAAERYCVHAIVGNRKGWRLPMVHELMSLVERPSQGLALPPGHPFNEVVKKPEKEKAAAAFYWSATTAAVPNTTSQAWGVDFINWGVPVNVDKYSGNGFVWCVRGGTGGNPR